MNTKEIASTLWDDLVYYTIYKPMEIYRSIKHWWKCNGQNPYHWKLVWYCMFHHYSWDNSFNWQITKLYIQKSRKYFETHRYASERRVADIIKWQTICINLLDIILENREIWDWDDNGYKCLVKVNMRNTTRFAYRCTDYRTGKIVMSIASYELEPHELYMAKARRLLLRILDEKSDEWGY